MRTLDRLQPLALLVLRLAVGIVMIAHGYPKVTGFSHFHSMITGMGMPGWLAYLSAAAEFLGGILIVLGLFTRCAALAIFIDLSVALWKVHLKAGLGDKSYELPLAVAAIAFALIFFGGGPMSLDGIRGGGGGGGSRKSKS